MTFAQLTPTERARRIANTLLSMLPDEDQQIMIARAHAVGETWLGSTLLTYTDDSVVTTAEAAAIVYVGPSTIRKWHSLGFLRSVDRGKYVVADVVDAAAAVRNRRNTRQPA